jgi:sialic acid synthase SpsE
MDSMIGGRDRKTFEIRGRSATAGGPLFVIAEIGLNHHGSVDRALALVDGAAGAGVAAVKLQTLRGATLVAPSCPPPMHVRAASLQEFFAGFELDEHAHRQIADRAHRAGMAFISTPFDEDAIDMLVRVGVDAIKVASGDLTHLRLIASAAGTGLPLILSTGMSSVTEVDAALACAEQHGARSIALLHCVSAYPVPSGSENLSAIGTLSARFGLPVGLSDHGRDELTVPVAVALGASIYERHIVQAGHVEAVDAAVSSTADQLRKAIACSAQVRLLLGHGRRECLEAEAPNRQPSRRGLYAARPLVRGARLGPGDLACLRPEHELGANRWEAVLGMKVRCDIPAGVPITPAMLEGFGD